MCGTYSYIWTRIEINIMANRINMFTDSKWMVHFPLRPLCSVNVSTRRCDLSDMPKSALADMCHVAATVSQRYPHQHTQQRETYLYLSRISHICKDIWANICAYWQCHKWWCSSARPLEWDNNNKISSWMSNINSISNVGVSMWGTGMGIG